MNNNELNNMKKFTDYMELNGYIILDETEDVREIEDDDGVLVGYEYEVIDNAGIEMVLRFDLMELENVYAIWETTTPGINGFDWFVEEIELV